MRALPAFQLLTATLLGLWACGGNAVVDAGGTGASTGTGGGSGGAPIDCSAAAFGAFSKACATVGDCVIEIHQTDCCGSTVALGVSNAAAQAFQAGEAFCVAQFPGCGCDGMGPVAEDGQLGTVGQIQVSCQAGQCRTFVP